MRAISISIAVATILTTVGQVHAEENVAPAHGLAMHGDVKYGPDFTHFDYIDPSALKGGTIRLGVPAGSFDTLNRYTLKGVPAAGLGELYDTLVVESADEPFSQYGLIAESVEVPEDRSWIIFNLRPEARFHDGHPITADDVIFSLNILKEKGVPSFRAYYRNVAEAKKLGEQRVKFVFKSDGENRELPLIIGQLPILPKHYWEGRDFAKTTLEPPLGNGPYRIESVDPGRSITYVRVEDYWAKDLPVRKGQYNFDRVVYDYYRDVTVALEAFKAGQFDFRAENVSKYWATAYDIPAVKDGRLKLEEIPDQMPKGMQGFAFNTRRDVFKDPRVRRALAYAFDFETTNKNLFYSQYTRSKSYFSNSELAAAGLPEGRELEVLEKYRGRVPEEVFTTAYDLPATDGSGNIRAHLKTALDIFKEAGWTIRDRRLVNADTGQPMAFEILMFDPTWERITLPFVQNLERIGVKAEIRRVDVSQYKNRVDNFDFDMIVENWGQSLSPGNEQRNYWSSEAADIPGSGNAPGIKDPVIDELIEQIIAAPDREGLVARVRALDRVLLWGHYVIPHWHITYDRLAYWDKFRRPEKLTPRGTSPWWWWIDPAKEAALASRQQQ